MREWGRVLTAMVTPFAADGSLDKAAVPRLVEYLLAHGSDGLVPSGTTGESPTLTRDEKLALFSLVKEAAGDRAAVIAGTGGNNTAEAVALSQAAARLGVDGILLVAPYYNKPSQEGLYRHFRAIAEAVPIPVMIYNVPGRTSVNIEAATVLRLARDVPNIVAVKEASGNLMQVSEIIAGAPAGFRVYSGEDGLVLPILALGGYGVVSVTSHLVGADLKRMHAAFLAGDLAEAARLHAAMLPIVKACFQPSTPSPVPVKAALNLLGIPVGAPRLPLVEATEAERAIITKAMADYGLLNRPQG
ncbi:MAG: 4-hydroxy-tetrahydrodipicolinate synthase [Chthonomonadales bacterium]